MPKKNQTKTIFFEKYSQINLEGKLNSFRDLQKLYCLESSNNFLKNELHYLSDHIIQILKKKRGILEIDLVLKFVKNIEKNQYEKSIYEDFLRKLESIKISKITRAPNPLHIGGGGAGNGTGKSNR
jgi:hypothetical protein